MGSRRIFLGAISKIALNLSWTCDRFTVKDPQLQTNTDSDSREIVLDIFLRNGFVDILTVVEYLSSFIGQLVQPVGWGEDENFVI